MMMRMSIAFATQMHIMYRPENSFVCASWGWGNRVATDGQSHKRERAVTQAVCTSHYYNSGFLDCHFVSNVSSFRRCFFRSDSRSSSSVNVKASTSGSDAKSCSAQRHPPTTTTTHTHTHIQFQLMHKGSLEVRLHPWRY